MNMQLKLPINESNLDEKIYQRLKFNQSKYQIFNMCKEDLYLKRKPNKIYRDQYGDISHMQIYIDQELNPKYILYNYINSNEKKHNWRDIVVKQDDLINKEDDELILYLNQVYNKARNKNKKVFIYQIEDELVWNKVFYEIIKIFHNYPISIYAKKV